MYRLQNAFILLFLAVSVIACSDNQPGSETADTTARTDTNAADTSFGQKLRSYMSEMGSLDSSTFREWLVDRYGVESGVVDLSFNLGKATVRQIRYFTDHGSREAIYTYYDSDTAASVGILEDGHLTVYEVGDTNAVRVPWTPGLPTALPNFSNLTDRMRRAYEIESIEPRTVLGRECTGYSLVRGPAVSKVWVWEGIMLAGESTATGAVDAETITFSATRVDTETPVPAEKFRLPQGMPVDVMEADEVPVF